MDAKRRKEISELVDTSNQLSAEFVWELRRAAKELMVFASGLEIELKTNSAHQEEKEFAAISERYLDEADAFGAANDWLNRLREPLQIDECHRNPCQKGGGIISAFSSSRLVALAAMIRDDRNHSLLAKICLHSGRGGKK